VTAGRMMAQKDAYDFTSAYARFAEVFGMDRAAYYDAAVSEYQVVADELEYLKATLIGLQQYGGGE
jgi:hypothetical protein